MRIIAGTAKGHTIKAPKGHATRPTQDRVRESMFNILSNYGLFNATVLDFFSGTGALALEALSRGACGAVCVDVATAKLIKENAVHCHLEDRVEVWSHPLMVAVKCLQGRNFDYIFADPPYEKGFVQQTLDAVIATDLLKNDGMLVIERHEKEEPVLPKGWQIVREQRFGYTRVTYIRRDELERS